VGSASEVLDALDELVGPDAGHALGVAAEVMTRAAGRLWAEGRIDEAEVVLAGVHRLLPDGAAWIDGAAPLEGRS
jgi:hypothetical protein